MNDFTPEGTDPRKNAPEAHDLPGSAAESGTPEQAAYPEGNILGRFADLFAKPGRLMDKVGSRPALWLAWLVIFLATALFSYMTTPIVGPEQMELMKDSPLMRNVPPEVLAEQMEEAAIPSVPKSLLGGFVSVWNAFLLGTLFWGFAKLSGGKGRWVQGLGITAWSGLIPLVLGPFLALPIILNTQTVMGTSLGLAALIPDGDPTSPLVMILKFYGDFPTWWGLALAVIGFQRVFALSRNSAILTVVLVWVVAMLVPLVPSLIFT